MNRSFLIMQSQTSDILYYYILAFPLISYTTSAALFITTALQYLITRWKRTRDVCYQPDHRQEIRIRSSGSALLLHHHQRLLLLHRLLIHHCWLLLLLHHHHRLLLDRQLLLRHLIYNDRGLLLHLRLLLHLLRLLHLLLLHLLLLHLLHLLLHLLILHLLLLHLLLHHCHLTGILIILRT